MAIVAIDAIVDSRYHYRCLKKRLDLKIGASEGNFALEMILREKNWKYMREYFSFINFENPLYFMVKNDVPEEALPIISQSWSLCFWNL